MLRFIGAIFAINMIILISVNSSHAKNDYPYYKGKRLVIIVPHGAGRTFDTYARTVSSYLEKEFPNKTYYPLLMDAICGTMKKIFLDDVILALKNEQYIVKVDKKIADPARKAIDMMFELTA